MQVIKVDKKEKEKKMQEALKDIFKDEWAAFRKRCNNIQKELGRPLIKNELKKCKTLALLDND